MVSSELIVGIVDGFGALFRTLPVARIFGEAVRVPLPHLRPISGLEVAPASPRGEVKECVEFVEVCAHGGLLVAQPIVSFFLNNYKL